MAEDASEAQQEVHADYALSFQVHLSDHLASWARQPMVEALLVAAAYACFAASASAEDRPALAAGMLGLPAAWAA